MHAVFGERDANGVANAVVEQRANADGGLDAAVFAVAGLGHAEMDRVIPVGAFFIQARDEQSIGLDHHLRVAGLHREDELVIIEFAGDAGELQRALDHAERRVAVAVHDAVAERAVIGADAHGAAMLFGKLHQRAEPLADALQLRGVLLIGVLDDLEFFTVGVVARIDTDLLDPLGGLHCGLGLEMNIRHDRQIAPLRAQSGDDVLKVGRVLHRGRGDADDLATDGRQIERLLDGRGGVHRVAGDHRLHADGIAPADADVPHPHLARRAAAIDVRRCAVFHGDYLAVSSETF